MSYNSVILTTGLDTENYPKNYSKKHRTHIISPVTIEEGVWLGANVTVCPGVKIASRIIIGAGSVVTKDLDKEGWLYAGIPAKPIKPLYKNDNS